MGAIPVSKRLVEINLYNLAALQAEALAREGEQAYRARLERAADQIQASGAHIVMLTGPSASGKTTSAHKLAQTLESRRIAAQVISLDNFFLGAENYPALPDGSKDYESPATLDMPEINRCLSALYTEGRADLPVYDFAREKRAAQRTHVELNGGVCIVEGIHALNPALTQLLPGKSVFRIYAGLREEYSDAGRRTISTRDIRLCRRVLRDAADRGHSPEKTLAMWRRVLEGENKYIKIYKNTADLLLDTSFSYELGVIAGLLGDTVARMPADASHYELLAQTAARFARVQHLSRTLIPADSMLQEFYGGM